MMWRQSLPPIIVSRELEGPARPFRRRVRAAKHYTYNQTQPHKKMTIKPNCGQTFIFIERHKQRFSPTPPTFGKRQSAPPTFGKMFFVKMSHEGGLPRGRLHAVFQPALPLPSYPSPPPPRGEYFVKMFFSPPTEGSTPPTFVKMFFSPHRRKCPSYLREDVLRRPPSPQGVGVVPPPRLRRSCPSPSPLPAG